MSSKRLAKEYGELADSPPEGFTVALGPQDSLHTWHVVHRPSAPSPYAGGTYGLTLSMPADYPFKPPTVKFVTRIYHPNVTDALPGNICLALLKSENWKPSTKIAAVLEAIRNLLIEPQPDDPLEERIADEYRNNRETWEKNAKASVEKHAMKEPEFPAAP